MTPLSCDATTGFHSKQAGHRTHTVRVLRAPRSPKTVESDTVYIWQYRPGGKSTAIAAAGRKKVHTTWGDGFEMVEEYDLTTDQLMLRKVRTEQRVGRSNKWEIEVGEEGGPEGSEEVGLMLSSDQPTIVRKDTKDAFQWRVRNVPWPLDTYQITAEPEANEVVIRTSNKKYFKRLKIPDLDRAGFKVEPAAISHTHANRTLVVSHRKPQWILQAEATLRQERAGMKTGKEGDVDCKQQ